ncbi:hypothetical protein [Erythrobacter sp. THAF29]|uniref:hypothetical protein n=1 Tax=Erythrobacter sp. THAF29 TaxID=2587851 RepID=UPI0012678811|nr:hypothetical protein [Erythrobacter sp. THAF29]QFT77035.1 hypothetical protein FIU90_05730 [Erythrobacter sp. THAF29]
MKFRNVALATAAVSLAASPAIAEAAFDRSTAPVEGESELEGGSGILIAILAAAAIIAGIIVAADDNGEDLPTSP